MMICPITGDATVQERDGQLHWLRADPTIHVSSELLDQADERGLAFLTARYEIGEWCPYNPTTRHARLRLRRGGDAITDLGRAILHGLTAWQARLVRDLFNPATTHTMQVVGIGDEEPPPDPSRACMICAHNPREMSVIGGGQVCGGCAGDVPVEMLPAGRGEP